MGRPKFAGVFGRPSFCIAIPGPGPWLFQKKLEFTSAAV